jgi:hypothetical protein
VRRATSPATQWPALRATLQTSLAAVLGLLLCSPAAAQPAPPPAPAPAAPAGGVNVETDPIRCWTRASAGSVRIGETFTATLTCAVLETELVQVIPDESKLAVTVAQMTPFEVAGGDHPADLRTNSRRFFQYAYNIRMMNSDSIGQDVAVPLLQVNYRVNSRVAGNQSQQGREMTYILEPIWIRVMSTVPRDATDIRDTRDASFGRIEAIAFRAGVLEIVAITLVALGSIMTLLALVGLARKARKSVKSPEDRFLSRPATLRLAARELAKVQRDASGGWSDALVNRALSALRISAAGALGTPISQRFVGRYDEPGEGRFIVRPLFRRKRMAVSAAATAQDLAAAINALRPDASESHRELLQELQSTLAALAAAQYGRPEADRSDLDATVARGAELARRVRAQYTGPRDWFRRMGGRFSLTQEQA